MTAEENRAGLTQTRGHRCILARDAAGTDRGRDEERSLILMYLREFANSEGMLGHEFDDLVRESFGDLLPQW